MKEFEVFHITAEPVDRGWISTEADSTALRPIALGVYVLEDGTRVQYGDEHLFRGKLPKNTNYIVWRKNATI